MKPTKQGSEATQFKKGRSGNPGGITSEERARNDALRLWLGSPTTEERGKAAYLKALDDGNSAVILDWANRRMGKVTDRLEVEDTTQRDTTPPLTNDERRELLRLQLKAEANATALQPPAPPK